VYLLVKLCKLCFNLLFWRKTSQQVVARSPQRYYTLKQVKIEAIIYSHIFKFNFLLPDFANGCETAECAKCEESGD
jgi:hypothetical protein